MSIKAVLWDFGGVFTSSPFEAFARHEAATGLPDGFIRHVNTINPDTNAWARLERSEIDAETFGRLFEAEALAAGQVLRGDAILPLLAGTIRPEMVAALAVVKQRYKTACLTNNVRHADSPGHTDERSAAIAKVMAMFDTVVESRVAGVRKPERRFYEIACETLGVQTAECVFLDDLGINLKTARAMGMQTIKVTSAAQALADLETVLGHRLEG